MHFESMYVAKKSTKTNKNPFNDEAIHNVEEDVEQHRSGTENYFYYNSVFTTPLEFLIIFFSFIL